MKNNYSTRSIIAVGILFTSLFSNPPAHAQVINTICGTGTSGDTGDGGPATAARIMIETGIYVDNAMNMYFTGTSNKVRKVDGSTGIITTIAGTGTGSYSGDGGPATAATFNQPCGLTLDAAGNIYVTEVVNSRIRKINVATGIITTVAGGGIGLGEGGPATACSLMPTAVKFDHSGAMVIADCGAMRIRKVNAMTGIITTIAGNGMMASYGDGGPATAAAINNPYDFCYDSLGNMYISEEGDPSLSSGWKIRRVDAMTGIITTVAGTGVSGYSGDGGPATAAMISSPLGIYMDLHGNVIFADVNNNRVRSINTATGIITTIVGDGIGFNSGDGGPATAAGIDRPMPVFVDTLSRVYVGSEVYRIRRISSATSTLNVKNITPFISSVYPNPSTGIFNVTFPDAAQRTVSVTDVTGREVWHTAGTMTRIELDLCDQPNGVYQIKVTGRNPGTQKIVVKH
jgi:hypothetical protein